MISRVEINLASARQLKVLIVRAVVFTGAGFTETADCSESTSLIRAFIGLTLANEYVAADFDVSFNFLFNQKPLFLISVCIWHVFLNVSYF
jgi:hypothetical protein